MTEVTVRVLPDWAGSLHPDSSRLGFPSRKGSRAVRLPMGDPSNWSFGVSVYNLRPRTDIVISLCSEM